MGKKVIIIGGVAGGASCAARLRRLDEEAEIILLERGAYISYANCGLPYRTGGIIRSKEALLLQTPEAMRKKFTVDVRVNNEAVAIRPEARQVLVRDLASGKDYTEAYDKLVIATGSEPLRPAIPGIESEKILTLWTVPDTERILSLIHDKGARSVSVIGGGFIGLEMADSLKQAGLDVTVIEMLDQVMAPLDFEMAQLLHENIEQNGVHLHLKDGVKAFRETGSGIEISLQSGTVCTSDFVILSIGIRPNGRLAKEAGLEMNARGGIVTDSHLRTSDPDIYAVGDVTEVKDFITGEKTMIPLAGPANKQGRIAADNIAGMNEEYEGSQGSSVVKVFDLTAASSGLNEKTLLKKGLKKGSDYESIVITQNSHAAYYPGAVPMTAKLLFSADGKIIYGAQIVGRDGVDKRIDTIAAAIRLHGTVEDLEKLELSYAPPYSSAKDPVNMAGFTAGNVLSGLVRFASWDAVEKDSGAVLLDVREDSERMAYSLPGAVGIPLGELRSRLGELDPEKEIITFCAIGVRAYNAARILSNHGFRNVLVYPGGARFYRSVHYRDELAENTGSGMSGQKAGSGAAEQKINDFGTPERPEDSGKDASSAVPAIRVRVDCSGMQCPGPIMKVFESVREMKDGELLEVSASDPGFAADIASWCRRTGNELVRNEKSGNDYIAVVRKKAAETSCAKTERNDPAPQNEGKTIIVFSGDLDKVLASFIIANGAAAMGRPVTMFFTFWGLTALRKEQKQPVRKTLIESMFGKMLPRGTKKLKLSRMNMGGMGTAMMKKIMKEKNVDSLEELMKKAMKAGVRIIACTMSMDVMGIKKEELIDGVELGGVGTYLGNAEESNVNLFV